MQTNQPERHDAEED
jgi:hypothetical protein